jgi:PPOX class probable F420-dependent enzyme
MEEHMFLDLNNPTDAHIDERLRSDAVIWLNSVRPDGRPHSVIVWFLWDGSQFLIFSRPKNQKLRNIRQNPNVVLALDNSKNGGDVITIEGRAELLDQKTPEMMNADYIKKYGAMIQSMGWSTDVMAADYSQPIRITPIKHSVVQ